MKDKKVLVVSAHAADYVWRAGGTIAKYAAEGAEVKIIVLSLGVRGESNDLWKQPGQTEETVKAVRKEECLSAARCLGIAGGAIEIWDYGDYPIEVSGELRERLVLAIRRMRPDIILTHDRFDIMNPDHNTVSQLVFSCSVQSNSQGVRIEGLPATKQMSIFGFEPHQTELSHFVPGSFIDITSSYEKKVEAMNCFQAQQHLIEIYRQRAFLRGNHARRLSGAQACKYAECFANYFPTVGEEFH